MGHVEQEVLGHLIAGRLHKVDRCFPFFVHSIHEPTYTQATPRYWQVGGLLKLRELLKHEGFAIRGRGWIDGDHVRLPHYTGRFVYPSPIVPTAMCMATNPRFGGVFDPRKCWAGVWRHEAEPLYSGLFGEKSVENSPNLRHRMVHEILKRKNPNGYDDIRTTDLHHQLTQEDWNVACKAHGIPTGPREGPPSRTNLIEILGRNKP
jgi:hypothetical protein